MSTLRFSVDHTAVLIVDYQEKLMPVIDDGATILRRASRLVQASKALGMPVLATEQYPRGLGSLVESLYRQLPEDCRPIEKMQFSALVPPMRDRLSDLGIRCVVVAGVESHVCVMQTCLDLLDAGYVTGVVVDATGSRRAIDKSVAIQRMVQAGVIPVTAESFIFEVVGDAGDDKFKLIRSIIKPQ